jgi:hypothetical protein
MDLRIYRKAIQPPAAVATPGFSFRDALNITLLPIFQYYLITYYDDLPAPGKGTAKTNGANGSTNPMGSPSPMESPSALASPSPTASSMTKNSSMATPSPSPAK